MPATVTDIGLYTRDGVVVRRPADPAVSAAIRAAAPTAQDTGSSPIEMFFDTEADAQVLLDERFALLGRIAPFRMGIEVDDTLGLGDTTPISPTVPCYRVVDQPAGLDKVVRVVSYALNLATDRYAIEVSE